MIKYITIGLLISSLSLTSKAQTTLLSEDFNSGIPVTWTVYNQDGLVPTEAVSEFTDGWISKVYDEDTVAASTSDYDPTGTASDFLVTPRISLPSASTLHWSARSLDASYPDGYQVLISTTDSLPGSFTDTLFIVSEESPYFAERIMSLDAFGYGDQDVFIAFQNNTDNGFILLIDEIEVYGGFSSIAKETDIALVIGLYPNPANNSITIQTEETILNATIYSADGKLISESNEKNIDISNLEAGIYFIQIETLNGQETLQFIKQ